MISSPSISDEYNLSHVHSNVIKGMFLHDGHNLSKGLPYLRAARNRAHIRARFHVGYQTQYLIIAKTYRDEGEREGQREKNPNCCISVTRRAGFCLTTTIWPCNREKRPTFRVGVWTSRKCRVCCRVTCRVNIRRSRVLPFIHPIRQTSDILYWTLGDSLAHVMFMILIFFISISKWRSLWR